jgi:Flp pilus assembly protein TadG
MKSRRQISQTQNRRGTALVEMALVLPIFVAVTLGIVEFGRAMMVGQLITNAAREGARLAIIDGSTNAEVTDYIEDFLAQSAGVQAADLTINITVTPAEGNPNPNNQVANALPRDLVTVYIAVPFNKVSYVTGNYLAGKNLSGRSAMRHE